jgi:hypothetical protein
LWQNEKRAAMAGGDKLDALLYTMPVRVRKTDQGRWEGDGDGKPFDRTTVSRDWHKAALQDADLRDMPLHALRHTAAAAWLAGGNSLRSLPFWSWIASSNACAGASSSKPRKRCLPSRSRQRTSHFPLTRL